jgi:uncharacterized coiled-coil protein SlyX
MIFKKGKRIEELEKKVAFLLKRVEALDYLLNQRKMVKSDKPRVFNNDPR